MSPLYSQTQASTNILPVGILIKYSERQPENSPISEPFLDNYLPTLSIIILNLLRVKDVCLIYNN